MFGGLCDADKTEPFDRLLTSLSICSPTIVKALREIAAKNLEDPEKFLWGILFVIYITPDQFGLENKGRVTNTLLRTCQRLYLAYFFIILCVMPMSVCMNKTCH